MRRRFNQALLPKHPPKRGESLEKPKPIGSPFNQWFRAMLEEFGIDVRGFCSISGQPQATVHGWIRKHDPQSWGQCRIARGFEKLGAGEYVHLRKTIRDLCDKK